MSEIALSVTFGEGVTDLGATFGATVTLAPVTMGAAVALGASMTGTIALAVTLPDVPAIVAPETSDYFRLYAVGAL